MGPKGQRFRIPGIETLHQLGPQHARSAHFGDLHEVVHAHAPEERDTGGEIVDVEARLDAGAKILQPVGQRVGQLDIGRSAGFLHVVSADADAVEFRHRGGAVTEDVADDPHRLFGRIDICVADHEFFQDVVLNGSAQFFGRHALLFGGDDIERHEWAVRLRSWSSTPTCDRAGCRRREYSCREWNRWLLRPCQHLRQRARDRNRIRDGWRDRTRSRAPSVRLPGCGDRRRWTLPRLRTPHTGG